MLVLIIQLCTYYDAYDIIKSFVKMSSSSSYSSFLKLLPLSSLIWFDVILLMSKLLCFKNLYNEISMS